MTVKAQMAARLGLPVTATREEIVAEFDRRDGKRRDALVAAAVVDGRLVESAAKKWRQALDRTPKATEALLATLAPVLAPAKDRPVLGGLMADRWGVAGEEAPPPKAPEPEPPVTGWFPGVVAPRVEQ